MIIAHRPLDAVTLGEALAVFLADDGLPLHAATRFRRTVAGAEANVACALARLGHSVSFVGRVGDDAMGPVVRSVLRSYGVDDGAIVVDSTAPTGILVRDVSADRPTEVAYARCGSADSRIAPVDADADLVSSARVLHVSGITPVLSADAHAAVTKAVEAAQAAGTIVCLDPNIRRRLCPPDRAADVLRPLADLADIVVAGDDEAALLSGEPDTHARAAWFLKRGARLVVLKRGAAGAWATDGRESFDQPALAVRAVDPVGAGDAFAAGLLSALLWGRETVDALREAAAVAALVVATPGDLEGLPTAAQRDAILHRRGEVDR
jgi:2-dehydro-3-deoxygluconokinase